MQEFLYQKGSDMFDVCNNGFIACVYFTRFLTSIRNRAKDLR